MTPKRILLAGLLCAPFITLSGCGTVAPHVRVPAETVQYWTEAQAAQVDMDEALLHSALDTVSQADDHGIDGMLVVRHNKLVLEKYWNGYDKDTLHDLRSATKSITSLLAGIALDKGILHSIDDPMMDYLSKSYPDTAESKRAIRLRHLMTMNTGLECDDRSFLSQGNEDRMYRSRDWVGYFLNLPVERVPGGQSQYCTGGVVTLGRVIADASGQSIVEFSRKNLFEPLGIENVTWSMFDQKRQVDTGGHLYMRPRDMAKIGQLVLQGGKWNGQQVVSRRWLEQSTSEQTQMDGGASYGFLWWRGVPPAGSGLPLIIQASGNGGQLIFIVPELDLVSVFTGSNYNSRKAGLPFELFYRYILKAAQKS